MRRQLITLIIILAAMPLDAGWFSKATPAPDLEREQRLKVEQRLEDAQQQLDSQRETIHRLYAYTAYGAAGAVVLLIIGVALGSTVRRHERPK